MSDTILRRIARNVTGLIPLDTPDPVSDEVMEAASIAASATLGALGEVLARRTKDMGRTMDPVDQLSGVHLSVATAVSILNSEEPDEDSEEVPEHLETEIQLADAVIDIIVAGVDLGLDVPGALKTLSLQAKLPTKET